jgi:hypothetical protein
MFSYPSNNIIGLNKEPTMSLKKLQVQQIKIIKGPELVPFSFYPHKIFSNYLL